MTEGVNRIYIRKTDFHTVEDFHEYLNKVMGILTAVESNIVVAYQSVDPNIYIIECNTTDPALNGVFPFWISPEELVAISQARKATPKPAAEAGDDDGTDIPIPGFGKPGGGSGGMA